MEKYKGWELEIIDAGNSDDDRGKFWSARATKEIDLVGHAQLRPVGRYVQGSVESVIQCLKTLIDKVGEYNG